MAAPSDWGRFIEAAGGIYVPLTVNNDEEFSQQLTLEGVDYTDAEFSGGVRAEYEASSAILAGFNWGTPALVGSDTVVRVALSEAVIEGLRSGSDPGAVERFYYNIKVTPSGGLKRTFFAGEFLLLGA